MKLKQGLCGLLMLMSAGGSALAASPSKPTLPLEELRLFAEIFGKLTTDYVDPIDSAALLRDAVDGMLAGLDPHSAFLDAEEFAGMRISAEGKFGGLGIEIVAEDGFIKVIAPIDDSPAQRAGILPGDVIVMLDGAPVRGMRLGDAVKSLRGPAGSEIVLTLSREGANAVFDVKLVRAIIQIASVKGEMLADGFGYVRISSFQIGAGEELRAKIIELERENGRQLDGLALDLRNNPGGVLSSAVRVSDAFLSAGAIVSTRGRHGDDLAEDDAADSGMVDEGMTRGFNATPGDVTDDAPLVVLVNGGSASAAEIVAGALQDHGRAIIMGTRTFGKGSVQSVLPTSNGGALKLTTARYYTPLARSIQARGIIPDIIIRPDSKAAARAGAREIREADLRGHLQNNDLDASEDAGEARESGAKLSLAARDYQVGEALNLLKGMRLVKARADAGGAPN